MQGRKHNVRHKKVQRYKKGPVTTKKLDRRLKNLENQIELKYMDEYNTYTMSGAGGAQTLNNVGQSLNAIDGRVGNQLRMTSLQFKYAISTVSTAAVGTFSRVMVILDRTPGGASGSLFANGSPNYLGADGVLDNQIITGTAFMPYTHNTQKRYKILYDKVHIIDPYPNGATSNSFPMTIYKRKNIKLGYDVKYQDATSTIASLISNSIVVATWSDSAGILPSFTYSARIYYKDL